MSKKLSQFSHYLATPYGLLTVCLSLTVIFQFSMVIWCIPRGLDFTDESWQYSIVFGGKLSESDPWGFQILLSPFFDSTSGTIIGFRVTKLIVGLVVTFVLVKALIALIHLLFRKPNFNEFLLVLLLALLGYFLSWFGWPRTIAYNEIAIYGLTLFLSLFVLLIRKSEESTSGKSGIPGILLFATTIPIACFVTSLARFPLFLILIPIFIFGSWYVVFKQRQIIAAYGFIIGVFISLVFCLANLASVQRYFHAIFLNLFNEEVRKANAHSSSVLFDNAKDLVSFLINHTIEISLISVALILIFISINALQNKYRQIQIVANGILLLALFVIIRSLLSVVSLPESQGIFLIWLAILLFLYFFIFVYKPISNRRTFQKNHLNKVLYLFLFLLFVSPLLSGIGTNNSIITQSSLDGMVWFGMLGVALVISVNGSNSTDHLSWIRRAITTRNLLVLLVCLTSTAFAVFSVKYPYRNEPLTSQNFQISRNGPLNGLLLSESSFNKINWILDSKNLLPSNYSVIALDSPWPYLGLGPNNLGGLWLTEGLPSSFDSLGADCQSEKPTKIAIIVPSSLPKDGYVLGRLQAELNKCGINFPLDFDEISRFETADQLADQLMFLSR